MLTESEEVLYKAVDSEVRLLIDKLLSQIKATEERCSSVEAGKRAELINLEQNYHDLENSFFEMQKSLNEEVEEKDRLKAEMEGEREKNASLRVGVDSRE
ncbi:uncharacterized protein [Blastocystis hominis]|uniref:Uncharacterized protein n=1 Tax=Blastocystis hominis TaxID=12968 RepID=D8M2C5_BLAHO|nr:uncharacterized protein [Blastocystis hominis]CBK22220.2 unnamed protein product [Blastocystis hominis]|eukprot:XP_012896268.1 uncharacterized protein [Blastocystis hominis]